MPINELERFVKTWDREAENTLKLLRALPASEYDFRPDQGGRSLGELAWHLAEGDAYMSVGIEKGQFGLDLKPPNIERPRQVEGLAPAYERVHNEAVARIKKLTPADLDRTIQFFWPILRDSRHSVGHDHLSQCASSRTVGVDVSSCGRPGARALRSQPRRDGRYARKSFRPELSSIARAVRWKLGLR